MGFGAAESGAGARLRRVRDFEIRLGGFFGPTEVRS